MSVILQPSLSPPDSASSGVNSPEKGHVGFWDKAKSFLAKVIPVLVVAGAAVGGFFLGGFAGATAAASCAIACMRAVHEGQVMLSKAVPSEVPASPRVSALSCSMRTAPAVGGYQSTTV